MGIKIISEWNIALMVKHLKSICDAKQNQFGGIEFCKSCLRSFIMGNSGSKSPTVGMEKYIAT